MRRTKNSLGRATGSIKAALAVVAVLGAGRPAAADSPLGTAFTYSGELQQGGSPIDDTCEFEFSLWDDGDPALPENQVGATLPETVIVEDGRLNVVLDYGANIFIGLRPGAGHRSRWGNRRFALVHFARVALRGGAGDRPSSPSRHGHRPGHRCGDPRLPASNAKNQKLDADRWAM